MSIKLEFKPLEVKLDNLNEVGRREFLLKAAEKVYDYAVDTPGVSAKADRNHAGEYTEGSGGVPGDVDSGDLRQSLHFDATGEEGWVGTNSDYGVYVHRGTGLWAYDGAGREATDEHPIPWVYKDGEGNFHTTYGQAPNPFLTRALEIKTPEIMDLLKETIKEVVK